MGTTGFGRVQVPAPTPIPLPFGLASVVTLVDATDAQVLNGISYHEHCCPPPELLHVACGEDLTKEQTCGDGDPVEADPLVVYGLWECGALGYTWAEVQERARIHFAGGEWWAVERALMTGEAGNAPSFAGADDLTPAAGAVSLVWGLAILQDHLAGALSGAGIIHMPPSVATFATYHATLGIVRSGDRLLTGLGHRVAVGAGYVGNIGPDGTQAPPGEAWIWATGQITARRSEIIANPDEDGSIDIRRNDRILLLERAYLLDWACVTAAVRVRLDDCCCP